MVRNFFAAAVIATGLGAGAAAQAQPAPSKLDAIVHSYVGEWKVRIGWGKRPDGGWSPDDSTRTWTVRSVSPHKVSFFFNGDSKPGFEIDTSEGTYAITFHDGEKTYHSTPAVDRADMEDARNWTLMLFGPTPTAKAEPERVWGTMTGALFTLQYATLDPATGLYAPTYLQVSERVR